MTRRKYGDRNLSSNLRFYVIGSLSLFLYRVYNSWDFSTLCLSAGLNLYKGALAGVLRSPVSFFDTTPMGMRLYLILFLLGVNFAWCPFSGRISARLTKDQSAIDNQLPFALLQVRLSCPCSKSCLKLLIVFLHICQRLWDDRSRVLCLPVPRDFIHSSDYSVLWSVCVLPPFVCGGKTPGFYSAFLLVCIVFRYVALHWSLVMGVLILWSRNSDWPFHNSRLFKTSMWWNNSL